MIRLISILKESVNYALIKKKAISNAKNMGYEEGFINYLEDFYEVIQGDVEKIQSKLVNKKINIGNTPIKIKKIELSGSYKKGIPKPESDVDIIVYYLGDANPTDVVEHFREQLSGNFGTYDVHAEMI